MEILEPTYCNTMEEVRAEMARRRKESSENVIVKFEKSPYGGFRVYSVFVDSFIDDLTDPIVRDIKRNTFLLYG